MSSAVRALVWSVLCCGLAAPVLVRPALASELDIAQEQIHLQTVSATYSAVVPADDNLPLQFRGSDRPKGQKLINLSF